MKETTIGNSRLGSDFNNTNQIQEKKGEVHHLPNGAVVRINPDEETIRDTKSKTLYFFEKKIDTKDLIGQPFGMPFVPTKDEITLEVVKEQEILGDKVNVSINSKTGEVTLWYHDEVTGKTKKVVLKNKEEYNKLLRATHNRDSTVSELIDDGIITADSEFDPKSLEEQFGDIDLTKFTELLNEKDKPLIFTEA
ncbi:MAG: hypothetical protein HRT47_10155 [Candidatus Caenarcaniphilales bacterium]|nr:hypothetical protein [Candidatus Caenarcaniphilales bacterium]